MRPYLAIKSVETLHTVRVVLLGYIAQTSQGCITEPTTEMLHVPRLVLRLRVLPGENNLKIEKDVTMIKIQTININQHSNQ